MSIVDSLDIKWNWWCLALRRIKQWPMNSKGDNLVKNRTHKKKREKKKLYGSWGQAQAGGILPFIGSPCGGYNGFWRRPYMTKIICSKLWFFIKNLFLIWFFSDKTSGRTVSFAKKGWWFWGGSNHLQLIYFFLKPLFSNEEGCQLWNII